MDQSLSISITLEGGIPSIYLSVQDHYHSPSQTLLAPMEFIDLGALVSSAQKSQEQWIITATPDNPRFQLESPILVRHAGQNIYWDVIFEHYEPFLNIDTDWQEEEDLADTVITFSFDRFQYISALYQGFQACQHLPIVTYTPAQPDLLSPEATPAPEQQMQRYLPTLLSIWQKYGQHDERVVNGQPTCSYDFFAQEAEKLWLQDLLNTLDTNHSDRVTENLDAYLESLPDDILSDLEYDHTQLSSALAQRWETLVDSLTEDEAASLEEGDSANRFPDSLKLRLMREFLNGNPSILLGQNPEPKPQQPRQNVINIQNWRAHKHAKQNQQTKNNPNNPDDPEPA